VDNFVYKRKIRGKLYGKTFFIGYF